MEPSPALKASLQIGRLVFSLNFNTVERIQESAKGQSSKKCLEWAILLLLTLPSGQCCDSSAVSLALWCW